MHYTSFQVRALTFTCSFAFPLAMYSCPLASLLPHGALSPTSESAVSTSINRAPMGKRGQCNRTPSLAERSVCWPKESVHVAINNSRTYSDSEMRSGVAHSQSRLRLTLWQLQVKAMRYRREGRNGKPTRRHSCQQATTRGALTRRPGKGESNLREDN